LAVTLGKTDFDSGGLLVASYARPGKLFTAHESLLVRSVGRLKLAALDGLLNSVIALLRPAGP
jgi:mRNA interferase MazF